VTIALEKLTVDTALEELEKYQSGFQESYEYYNAEPRDLAVGISTPPQLRKLLAQVGIPRIYINAVTERLIVDGFQAGKSEELSETLWNWFRVNDLDTQATAGFQDAAIYSRSYITISMPDETETLNPLVNPEIPRIRVESPLNLFAQVNPRTREVDWAIRRVKDDTGELVAATLYTPTQTIFYYSDGSAFKQESVVNHNLGIVPVVPVNGGVDNAGLYGSSLITKEIRSITDAISRILMNMQVTSETLAHPQRVLNGVSLDELTEDGEKSPMELYIASYLAFDNPDSDVKQLPAAELSNYTTAISQLMKLAASYTGLPPQYLNIESDNPASAEAIKASESRLIKMCERLCNSFGEAWEKAMKIALLAAGKPVSDDFHSIEVVWRNPGTPTYQAMMDAATKAYAAGVLPLEQIWIDLGYTPEQRRQMRSWVAEQPSSQLASLYSGGVMAEVESGTVPDETETVGE